MKVTCFNLKEDQKKWLDVRTEETGATMAALLRKAVDLYIKTTEEKEQENQHE